MCNFFSALGLPDGSLHWHWMLDSHSDLVVHAGIDDNDEYNPRFAKLELTPHVPTDELPWHNVDAWTFHLDDAVRAPWVSDELMAEWSSRMRSIVRRQTILTGEKRMIVDGVWLIGGVAKVENVMAGRILCVRESASIRDVSGGSISDVSGSVTLDQSGPGSVPEGARQ